MNTERALVRVRVQRRLSYSSRRRPPLGRRTLSQTDGVRQIRVDVDAETRSARGAGEGKDGDRLGGECACAARRETRRARRGAGLRSTLERERRLAHDTSDNTTLALTRQPRRATFCTLGQVHSKKSMRKLLMLAKRVVFTMLTHDAQAK